MWCQFHEKNNDFIYFFSFSGIFQEAKRGRVNAMLKIRPCKVSYHPPQCQSSGALSYTLNSILRYVIVYFFKKDIKMFVWSIFLLASAISKSYLYHFLKNEVPSIYQMLYFKLSGWWNVQSPKLCKVSDSRWLRGSFWWKQILSWSFE